MGQDTKSEDSSKRDYADLLDRLPGLSAKQRDDLSARLVILQDVIDNSDVIHQVYSIVQNLFGGGIYPSIAQLRRCRRFPLFKRQCIELAFYARQISEEHKRDFIKILTALIVAIRRHLKRDNTPHTVWTIGYMMARIHMILETQFPGYVDADLLLWITYGARCRENKLQG